MCNNLPIEWISPENGLRYNLLTEFNLRSDKNEKISCKETAWDKPLVMNLQCKY